MLKHAVMLEIVKGERVYQFSLPSDSPLGEVHDVLFEMRNFVVNKLNESLNADKPKEQEQIKTE